MSNQIRKNQTVELEITDYSDEGLGVGKADGFVYFVKDTVIGDRVLASVMKCRKNFGFARLQKILVPSPDRVTPPCPESRRCGGCSLQAVSYPAQLSFKERKVRNDLLRIGHFSPEMLDSVMDPIVGMEDPLRYRNKAQFPVACVNGEIAAGFYAGRTHQVIPCTDCLTGVKENADLLSTVLLWMKQEGIPAYDEKSGRGLVRHVLIRKAFATGELMVCLVVSARRVPHLDVLTDALCGEDAAHRVSSLSLNINPERSNVIMGREMLNVFGPGYISDRIGPLVFRISPLSFYQVNPVQTERMYDTALEYAELSGKETVWDLYCGIGTISLFLAQKARKVYGVEIIPEAVQDAERNAGLNGITNACFYTGAAENVLPRWYQEHPEERIDVVSVDPPRKGLDDVTISTILSMAPERIVYVSCNPATLARDLAILAAGGYQLQRVRPFDNFPESCHVETVVLMERH